MLDKMKQFDEKLSLWSKDFQKITWNETINSYAENLTKTKVILNDLLTEEDHFKPLKEEIQGLQSEIDKYISTASNPEYQIAIVGAIKAGKSTLINALLGYDLASVDVTPETATLTKIKASEKNYVKTSFYTNEDWDKIWSQANNPKKKAEVFLKEYESINAESVKNSFINKKEVIFESENYVELKEEIKKWTSSKAKEHYFVKEIEIGLSSLDLDKQICIVDTPGLNDVVEYRSNITLEYIDRANAVIVCVNAKTLRNEELLTIARVFSRARHKKDKIYVLGTQLDTLNSIDDWKKQKLEWKKYLFSDEFYDNPKLMESNLLGVSAYLYNGLNEVRLERSTIAKYESMKLISEDEADELRYLSKKEDFALDYAIKSKILEFSNIDKIKNIVFRTLIDKFNETILNDNVENYNLTKARITEFKTKHIKSVKELLDATKLSKEELETTIEMKKKEMDEMKKKINEISTSVDKVSESFQFDFKELEGKFNEIKEGIKNIRID